MSVLYVVLTAAMLSSISVSATATTATITHPSVPISRHLRANIGDTNKCGLLFEKAVSCGAGRRDPSGTLRPDGCCDGFSCVGIKCKIIAEQADEAVEELVEEKMEEGDTEQEAVEAMVKEVAEELVEEDDQGSEAEIDALLVDPNNDNIDLELGDENDADLNTEYEIIAQVVKAEEKEEGLSQYDAIQSLAKDFADAEAAQEQNEEDEENTAYYDRPYEGEDIQQQEDDEIDANGRPYQGEEIQQQEDEEDAAYYDRPYEGEEIQQQEEEIDAYGRPYEGEGIQQQEGFIGAEEKENEEKNALDAPEAGPTFGELPDLDQATTSTIQEEEVPEQNTMDTAAAYPTGEENEVDAPSGYSDPNIYGGGEELDNEYHPEGTVDAEYSPMGEEGLNASTKSVTSEIVGEDQDIMKESLSSGDEEFQTNEPTFMPTSELMLLDEDFDSPIDLIQEEGFDSEYFDEPLDEPFMETESEEVTFNLQDSAHVDLATPENSESKPYIPPDESFDPLDGYESEIEPGDSQSGVTESPFEDGTWQDRAYKKGYRWIKGNDFGGESVQDFAKDQRAQVAFAVLLSLCIILSLLTASWILKHPDGYCSSICRLSLVVVGFICRVLCTPCRRTCCQGGRKDDRLGYTVGSSEMDLT